MKKKYKILLGVLALLIVIRICLPYIVLHFANKKLADMPGYYGHIEDIDLALIVGAYTIKDIYLNKVDSVSDKQTDFFKSRTIELSIEWPALFKGRIVGELFFESPELIFTKNKTEIADIKGDTTDFRNLLKSFMPLKVNRVEVNNGIIEYRDPSTNPPLDLSLKQTYVLALNLSNVVNDSILLPSTVTAKAMLYGGEFIFNMKLNALAPEPTFDLNASLKNTELAQLNDFFRAYGNFDVTSGEFGMYTEVAAKEGKFVGYVKPLLKNLNVVGPDDKKDNLTQKLWERLVGGVGVLFQNQRTDQLATKVQMEGNFDNPQISIFDAIWQVIRNAFIQALIPSIDNEINISSVGEIEKEPGFLEKIFDKDKDDKKKDDKKKDKNN